MIASDYTFNKMTNINDDSCALTQTNIENSQAENYMLNNFFPACPMTKAIDFATQQPFVFYLDLLVELVFYKDLSLLFPF
jgi:hypothetical protein